MFGAAFLVVPAAGGEVFTALALLKMVVLDVIGTELEFAVLV